MTPEQRGVLLTLAALAALLLTQQPGCESPGPPGPDPPDPPAAKLALIIAETETRGPALALAMQTCREWAKTESLPLLIVDPDTVTGEGQTPPLLAAAIAAAAELPAVCLIDPASGAVYSVDCFGAEPAPDAIVQALRQRMGGR